MAEEKKKPEMDEKKDVPELETNIHKTDYEIKDHPHKEGSNADESVRETVNKDMQQRKESQSKDGENNINVQGTSEY